jgi:hypothetical protein
LDLTVFVVAKTFNGEGKDSVASIEGDQSTHEGGGVSVSGRSDSSSFKGRLGVEVDSDPSIEFNLGHGFAICL